MFVSYLLSREKKLQLGYMCFNGTVQEEGLAEFIADRLFVNAVLILARLPYREEVTHVTFFNTKVGIQRIQYDKPLSNVEEIGDLYLMLHREYGFSNIIRYD